MTTIVDIEPTVTITVGEFIDNIERNGWTQKFGAVFNEDALDQSTNLLDRDKVTEACAFGQGMLNANIHILDDSVWNKLNWRDIYETISRWNDKDLLSIPTIVKLAREKYADQLDEKLYGWTYEDYKSGNIPMNNRGINRG